MNYGVELILSALVAGAVAYPVASYVKRKHEVIEDGFSFKVSHSSTVEQQPAETSQASPEYAVERKPRRIPWSIRRRELEASTKKKRKLYESFQGE